MLKKLSFVASLLLFAGTAFADPLTLSVNGGGWSNPVKPSGVCADIDNQGGSLQDEVRWGGGVLTSDPTQLSTVPAALADYVHGNDACWLDMDVDGTSYHGLSAVSGYNFDPFDGTYEFPGTASPFSLGTFQHINSAIDDGITSVDYSLLLNTNDSTPPPANPLAVNMSFQHNETDNQCVGDGCSDDIVTVVLPATSTVFQVGADLYLFQLLGFSTTGLPGTFTSMFTSPENKTNETQLWAQVNPVPEPATLTLLGSGLVGLGAAARRRLRARRAAC